MTADARTRYITIWGGGPQPASTNIQGGVWKIPGHLYIQSQGESDDMSKISLMIAVFMLVFALFPLPCMAYPTVSPFGEVTIGVYAPPSPFGSGSYGGNSPLNPFGDFPYGGYSPSNPFI